MIPPFFFFIIPNFYGTVNVVLQFAQVASIIALVMIMEKKWYVYILRCADKTLYTGITNDLDRRLDAHNAGTASKYTRVRRPVAMVYREEIASKGDALRRELQIKALSRQQKEQLIIAKK